MKNRTKRKIAMLCSLLLLISGSPLPAGDSMVFSVEAEAAETVDMSRLLDMDELYGWAAVAAQGIDGVDGGGSATPQIVTTLEELTQAAGDDIPRVIVVSGRITTSAFGVSVGSNKTIVGIDEEARICGGFRIANESNIIINNLNIQGTWPYYGVADCVEIKNSHHVWLNHLSIWNSTDGNIDITMGSDYVTVSWCKLWYTIPMQRRRTIRTGSAALSVPVPAMTIQIWTGFVSPIIITGLRMHSRSGCRV